MTMVWQLDYKGSVEHNMKHIFPYVKIYVKLTLVAQYKQKVIVVMICYTASPLSFILHLLTMLILHNGMIVLLQVNTK